ncbi:MAG TPA: ABC transporter substrate binding protein [Bryobacteraceae bacterium]|jgi:putative ABC transport system substrate-binding protein|nr:ABC transporter substrate binding protein [Bryobacteraceae bacterium]
MSVLARLCLAAVSLPASQAAIVVVYEPGVDAYAEALEGLGAGLASNPFRVVELPGGKPQLARILNAKDTQLIIAVGSRALAAVQSQKAAAPVLATMVLRGREIEGSGHVDLDVPLPLQCGAMRALWPRHTRIGIIRNPARSRYSAEALESRARKEGFTAMVVDCDGPAGLLKAVAAMKGKVDYLLCFPDPDLYNAVTIKPLVMASLESRLPIVGFSPAFVRAGAAAGIYPDYRETGRQTAEMALRMMRGEERAAEEGPRKIQISVNQRIAHLLGVEFHTSALPVEVFR